METFVENLIATLQRGQGASALAMVTRLEREDPVRYHLGMAILAGSQNHALACREFSQKALELAPDEPMIVQQAAFAEFLCNQPDKAEEYARRAVAQGRTQRSLEGLAHLLLNRKKFVDAEAVYRELLDHDGGNIKALNGLGLARHGRGDQATALQHFAAAFHVNPNDPTALKNLLNVYKEFGWQIGALILARTTRMGYHDDSVNVVLDLLIFQLSRAIEASSPGQEFINSREVAATLVQTARHLRPRVQLSVAQILFHEEQFDMGKEMVSSMANQDFTPEERAMWHLLMGHVAQNEGDTEGALSHYEVAVAGDSKRWDACCNALSLLFSANTQSALERAGRLLDRVPSEVKDSNPELLYNEAVYWGRIGRLADAAARCRALVARHEPESVIATMSRELLSRLDAAAGGPASH